MLANKNRTEISELGEFGLIKHLTESIKLTQKSTIKGVGDDAAVIEANKNQIVISTDMLVEGVHFDMTYVPLKHLGYKAVIVNLSDIYAMNCIPQQITVSIAVSNRFSLEAIEELYVGINTACELYNVDLVGGDTTSSLSGLVISITAIGNGKKENIVYRNTANEKDLLCVSGDLGGAYLGLQMLEREKQIFKENPNVQPDLGNNDYVIERQLKPEARKDVIEELAKLNIVPTAMIDVSDGLASEIHHICSQSDKGCDIYADKIPIDPTVTATADELKLDSTVCALNGGEDYELLFTVKQADYEAIQNLPLVSIIGHITDAANGINLITSGDTSTPITAQGWDGFRE